MFFKCASLISLPDISKWNTSNVTNLNSMFKECVMLQTIPDISKWDMSKVNNCDDMFNDCHCLRYLPGFIYILKKCESISIRNLRSKSMCLPGEKNNLDNYLILN